MQADGNLLDGVLEIVEAVLDPALVPLPSFESLGVVLLIAICAVFLGITRVLAPKIGAAGAIAMGLVLAIALLSSRQAINTVGALVVVLACVLKLVAGAALGGLMGRSLAVALLSMLAALLVAWGVSYLVPGLGGDGIAVLKVLVVIVGGIGTFDLLVQADQQGLLNPLTHLGFTILIAGSSLVDVASAVGTSDPQLGVALDWFVGRTFGVGLGVGFLAALVGSRRGY